LIPGGRGADHASRWHRPYWYSVAYIVPSPYYPTILTSHLDLCSSVHSYHAAIPVIVHGSSRFVLILTVTFSKCRFSSLHSHSEFLLSIYLTLMVFLFLIPQLLLRGVGALARLPPGQTKLNKKSSQQDIRDLVVQSISQCISLTKLFSVV